jgi:LAGLIDADG endonuclease
VNIEHLAVLERLQGFFGVGKIYTVGSNATYRVTKLSELVNVIIPHFTTYPLLTNKVVTFTAWVLAVSLFTQGAHKTESGFMQILSIYAATGRGASQTVFCHFSNLIPYTLPAYTVAVTTSTLNSWWLSGYCTLYCSFICYVTAGMWKVDPTRNYEFNSACLVTLQSFY